MTQGDNKYDVRTRMGLAGKEIDVWVKSWHVAANFPLSIFYHTLSAFVKRHGWLTAHNSAMSAIIR
jgi:hypothetical protein